MKFFITYTSKTMNATLRIATIEKPVAISFLLYFPGLIHLSRIQVSS